jgi:hypothetical protein
LRLHTRSQDSSRTRTSSPKSDTATGRHETETRRRREEDVKAEVLPFANNGRRLEKWRLYPIWLLLGEACERRLDASHSRPAQRFPVVGLSRIVVSSTSRLSIDAAVRCMGALLQLMNCCRPWLSNDNHSKQNLKSSTFPIVPGPTMSPDDSSIPPLISPHFLPSD